MLQKVFALVLTTGIVVAMVPGVFANPITWGNTPTNFEVGTSWGGGNIPTSDLTTDVARFNSAATVQPSLTADRSIAGLDYATPLAGGWTLSGGFTLTLGAGTLDSGNCGIRAQNTSGLMTISATGLDLGTNQSWSVVANQQGRSGLLVSSNVGEDVPGRTLAKVGAGELTLTGTNTYSGGTTLTAGRLNIDAATAIGTGTLTINGGTLGRRLPTGVTVTLTNNNPVVVNGNFAFVHSGGGAGGNNTSLNLGTGAVSLGTAAGISRTIDVSNHRDYIKSSLIIGGTIADGTTANGIIKTGAGFLILSGVNNYSGTTTINAGVLQFNSPQAIAGSGANVTVNADGAVAPGYDIDQAFLGRIVSTSAGTVALTVNSATDLDFSAGGVILTAASLGAVNGTTLTYSGVLTPNGTTYRLGGGGGTLIVSSALTGDRSVTVRAALAVVLTNANTYSGQTLVGVAGDGNLIIGHNDALGTTDGTAATGVTLQGNQPFLDMRDSITVTGELLTMTCTHPGVRASLRSISGNNTWAGNIVAPASVGLTGGNFTASAGAPLTINGNITLTAPSGAFVFTPAGSTITINGVISGPVTLTMSGQGTVVLSGSNTYNTVTSTGIAIISVNTLRNAGVPSPLGVNGTINISGGNEQGTLKYTGTGDTTDLVINMFGSSAWGSRIEQAGTGLLRFTGNMTAAASASARILTLQGSTVGVGEFAGLISNAGTVGSIGVTKAGTGLWILSGPNTYTNVTTVSAGVLRLDHATALPGGISSAGGLSPLTLAGGLLGLGAGDFSRDLGTGANQVRWTGNGGFAAYGTNRVVNLGGASAGVTWGSGSFVPSASALMLSATSATHTVDFQNPIAFGNAIRTVQVDNGAAAKDAILSGALSGVGGGLTKTGAGTLVLTASNTYGTAATTVSAGTLLVNGSLDVTPITVNSNATLGGTGRVAGTVLVKNGGKLAPGDSAGTFTTGSLTLENNAELLCSFSGANNAGKVVASGLTLGANTVLRLRDAGAATPGGEFVLIQYSGTDPALGNWSVDIQVPGVLPADVSVYQDTANDRIMLHVNRRTGTLILLR